jgi:hypothetical protein
MPIDPTWFEMFLFWYGQHWFLGLLILIVFYALVYHFMRFIFLIIAFLMRQRNIKHHGWPPTHLDADGSFEKDE